MCWQFLKEKYNHNSIWYPSICSIQLRAYHSISINVYFAARLSRKQQILRLSFSSYIHHKETDSINHYTLHSLHHTLPKLTNYWNRLHMGVAFTLFKGKNYTLRSVWFMFLFACVAHFWTCRSTFDIRQWFSLIKVRAQPVKNPFHMIHEHRLKVTA